MTSEIEKYVFFGKGGIGKSTISSNISAVLGIMGHKVLHVGCDPKMDSSLGLAGRHTEPYSSAGYPADENALRRMISKSPYIKNVSSIEAGGPEPGLGCAGVAIGRLLEAIGEGGMLSGSEYERIVFDVLGDVVCGGFATPLKKGFARKAIIISSEEILSLYAANNLLKMIKNYSRNGVYAAGIVLNVRDPNGIKYAEKYAAYVNLPVLGIIDRDDAVYHASKINKAAVLFAPKSKFSKQIVKLALNIESSFQSEYSAEPLSDEEFELFASKGTIKKNPATENPSFRENVKSANYNEKRKLTIAELDSKGIELCGINGEEVLFKYKNGSVVADFILSPKNKRHNGAVSCSDWDAYISLRSSCQEMPRELQSILKDLSEYEYNDFVGLCVENLSFMHLANSLPGKPQTSPKRVPYPYLYAQDTCFAYRLDPYYPEPGVLIEYSDDECRFNDAPADSPASFFSFSRSKGARQPLLPGRGYFNTRITLSELNRNFDGGFAKSVNEFSYAGLDSIRVHLGCTHALSPSSCYLEKIDELKNSQGIDIHYEKLFGKDADENFKSKKYAKELIDIRNDRTKKGDKLYDVCLVDYGKDSVVMANMLSEFGVDACIQEDGIMLPAFSLLQVMNDVGNYKSKAFSIADIPFIAPPAPYGIRNTSLWIKAIVDEIIRIRPVRQQENMILKKDLPAFVPPEEKYPEIIGVMGSFSAFFKGKKFYFVILGQDLEIFHNKAVFPAAFAIDFLSSCGFDVEILVSDSRKQDHFAIEKLKEGVNVRFCESTMDAIAILQSDNEKNYVYSDLRDDLRIMDMGKIPFSAAIIEPGYAGAAETLRRLAELSKI